MNFGRFLSNPSFKPLLYDGSFRSVSRPIRFFSGDSRFDSGPEDAISEFRRMVEMHPLPSVFEFGKLLSAVVWMKQYPLALQLFDGMLEREVPVNTYILSIVIDCFCHLKRPDFGLSILGSILKRGHEPDVVTFSTLLKGLFLVGRKEEAEKLLKNMVAHHIFPNVVTCNICIDALCKQGRLKSARRIFNLMKENRGVQPDISTYNPLINGYCSRGLMDQARSILDAAVNSGLQPTIVSYTSLMNGYRKKGQVDEVLCLFTEITVRGLEHNAFSYGTMLHAFFSAGRFEEGLKLFEEMKEAQWFSRDIKNYNIVVDGLCSARRVGEAFSVLQTMEDEGIVPDMVTYTSLIKGLCDDNRIREAKDLFHKLPSRGLQPNVVAYAILIRALCKEGLIDEAMDLMMQTVNNGCSPDCWTCKVFFGALLKWNRMHDAIPFSEEMVSRGFRLDASILSRRLRRKFKKSSLHHPC